MGQKAEEVFARDLAHLGVGESLGCHAVDHLALLPKLGMREALVFQEQFHQLSELSHAEHPLSASSHCFRYISCTKRFSCLHLVGQAMAQLEELVVQALHGTTMPGILLLSHACTERLEPFILLSRPSTKGFRREAHSSVVCGRLKLGRWLDLTLPHAPDDEAAHGKTHRSHENPHEHFLKHPFTYLESKECCVCHKPRASKEPWGRGNKTIQHEDHEQQRHAVSAPDHCKKAIPDPIPNLWQDLNHQEQG
mmetsp:Transcript_14310/g.27119  ORF Transcript_14310/g.27119 Transcript_14310/m.27119 type:complete len:251 (-) Transcript_14310:638-1390(-)